MKKYYLTAFMSFYCLFTIAQTWNTFTYQNTRQNWMHGVSDIVGVNENNLFLLDEYSKLFEKRNGQIESLSFIGTVSDQVMLSDTSLIYISNKYILKFKNDLLDTIRYQDTLPTGLSNYPIKLSIKNNILWSARRASGILKLDLLTQQETEIDSVGGMPIKYSSLIFNDDLGNVYGVCQNGVYKFDGVNGFWLDTVNNIHGNNAVVRNDTVWIATYTGLFVYSTSGIIAHYTRFNSDIAMNYCNDLTWHNDVLYISHHKMGISFTDIETGYSTFNGTSFNHYPEILDKEDYAICFEEVDGNLFMGTRFGPMLEYSDSNNDWIKEHGFNLNSEETRLQILQNNRIATSDNNSVSIYDEVNNSWQENDYSDDFGFSLFRPTKFGKFNLFGTKSQYGPSAIVELNNGQLINQLNDFNMIYYHESLKRAWGFQYGNFGFYSFTNGSFIPLQNLGVVKQMFFDEHAQRIWAIHFNVQKCYLVEMDVNGLKLNSWELSLENDFYHEYTINDIVVLNSEKVWIAVNELYNYESKLIIFDLNSETEIEMKNDFGGLILPDFHVEKMEVDCDNRVWFIFNKISSNKGIVIADSEDFFFQVRNDNSELYDDKVYDINFFNQTMWVGVKNALQSISFNGTCSAISMGVERDDDFNVELYPNPSSGQFYIKTKEESNLKLYDLNSRLMYTCEVYEGLNNINLELLQGVYLVSLTTTMGKVTTQKLVIE